MYVARHGLVPAVSNGLGFRVSGLGFRVQNFLSLTVKDGDKQRFQPPRLFALPDGWDVQGGGRKKSFFGF